MRGGLRRGGTPPVMGSRAHSGRWRFVASQLWRDALDPRPFMEKRDPSRPDFKGAQESRRFMRRTRKPRHGHDGAYPSRCRRCGRPGGYVDFRWLVAHWGSAGRLLCLGFDAPRSAMNQKAMCCEDLPCDRRARVFC